MHKQVISKKTISLVFNFYVNTNISIPFSFLNCFKSDIAAANFKTSLIRISDGCKLIIIVFIFIFYANYPDEKQVF